MNWWMDYHIIMYCVMMFARMAFRICDDYPLLNCQGFKLALSERVHDCASSLVQLDQLSPRRTLASPDFPRMSPNSLDCHWTLSAPPGRRVQFTVDHNTFMLQDPISDDDE